MKLTVKIDVGVVTFLLTRIWVENDTALLPMRLDDLLRSDYRAAQDTSEIGVQPFKSVFPEIRNKHTFLFARPSITETLLVELHARTMPRHGG